MDQSLGRASRDLSEAGRDVRHYVQRDGTICDGSTAPRWGLGQGPPAYCLASRVRRLSDIFGPGRHWVAGPDNL